MNDTATEIPSLGSALWRGFKGRCPQCGKGHVFDGYLRQHTDCPDCQLDTGAIRADDGPAWLTLLVVGHLLAPFMVIIFFEASVPMWLATGLMLGLATGLCLLLLPRAKGVFIAAIWKLGARSPQMPGV